MQRHTLCTEAETTFTQSLSSPQGRFALPPEGYTYLQRSAICFRGKHAAKLGLKGDSLGYIHIGISFFCDGLLERPLVLVFFWLPHFDSM